VSDRFLLQISALPRLFSAAEIRRGKQLMNALLLGVYSTAKDTNEAACRQPHNLTSIVSNLNDAFCGVFREISRLNLAFHGIG
jgi:hypothetical protein